MDNVSPVLPAFVGKPVPVAATAPDMTIGTDAKEMPRHDSADEGTDKLQRVATAVQPQCYPKMSRKPPDRSFGLFVCTDLIKCPASHSTVQKRFRSQTIKVLVKHSSFETLTCT